MIVDSVMGKPAVTMPASASLRDAARKMRERRIGCLIIVSGGRPTGIFTESDLAKAVAEDVDLDTTRLVERMSKPLVTIEASASLARAAQLMKDKRVRRLAVVVGEELRGVVTVRDLAFAMPQKERGDLDALRFRWQD